MLQTNDLTIRRPVIMRGMHEALLTLRTKHPRTFLRLFDRQALQRAPIALMRDLQDTGLVYQAGDSWQSRFRITWLPDERHFVVTDPFTLSEMDRVFPLSRDESLFLAGLVRDRKATSVLDIGTGSGVLALAAARSGEKVVAIDINQKALRYATFNASLNQVRRLDIRQGSCFESLDAETFDLIVSNPPVIPAPAGSGFFVHSDGGTEGTDVSLRVLAGARHHLKPNGLLLMLCTSFIGEAGSLAILDALAEQRPALHVCITRLYRYPLRPLGRLRNRFSGCEEDRWLAALALRGVAGVEYILVSAVPARRFSAMVRQSRRALPVDFANGSWQRRLERLFGAYGGILVTDAQQRERPVSLSA